VLGTLLSLGLLLYLIVGQWQTFTQMLTRVPLRFFWTALGLTLLSRMAVTLRWFALLRTGRVKISFFQALRLTFMGLFSSNFLPTTIGGDLVRLAGAVYLRLDAGVSAASLVLDRLIGMAGMSSLAPVGLWIILRPVGLAAPVVSSMGMLSGLSKLPGAEWMMQRVRKFTRSVVSSSAYWLRHPTSLVWALLCTYGHMLFTFLTVSLLLRAMGQPLSFWWIAGLWSLSYFITLVPVSINGLGVQELSISYLYSHFGGISMEAALALALFMRVLPVIASLPGVLFLPDILRPLPSTPARSDD
jgi:uncharacterized membrane protein YbhN (UPF0104 family)